MARVNAGSHSFTCHPHVHPQVQCPMAIFNTSRTASPHFGRYSFLGPLRVGGWVGLSGSDATRCQEMFR